MYQNRFYWYLKFALKVRLIFSNQNWFGKWNYLTTFEWRCSKAQSSPQNADIDNKKVVKRGILNLPLCHSYLESGWDFLFCKKFCTHLSTNFGSEGTNSRKSGKNSHKWKVRCWKNPVISGTGIIIFDGISLVQGEKHYFMAQTNIYTNYQNFQESQKCSEKDSSFPRLTLLISVLRTNYVTWYVKCALKKNSSFLKNFSNLIQDQQVLF